MLTTRDLARALDDERHLGFGYATAYFDDPRRVDLDVAVVEVANELGLDYEGLFEWSNSKLGRWLVDETYGSAKTLTPDEIRQAVRRYLNDRELRGLRAEASC